MGGFLREGFYLLQGDPGSGKTTVALQYVLGRVKAGEPCLYITLTESRGDLENACALARLVARRAGDLRPDRRSAANLAGRAARRPSSTRPRPSSARRPRRSSPRSSGSKPRHVVFDGLSEMRLLVRRLAPSTAASSWRSRSSSPSGRSPSCCSTTARPPFGDIQPESLVGGNIVLERYLPGVRQGPPAAVRHQGPRGRTSARGTTTTRSSDGGVVVHPRLVAAEHHERFERAAYPSGVANLDDMLDGGLTTGSTTLLLGPAGVGKSTVAMQFVGHALKAGDRAAVYMFDEVIDTLFDRSEKLCLGKPGGLRTYMADGLLHAQQVDPAEMSAGAFAHEVRRAVEAGAKVIVIDSLNGYLNAMPEERFLTTHLHELFAYLNQKGVVTIMVVAQHGMIGAAGWRDRRELPGRHGPAVPLLRGPRRDPPGRQRVQEADRRARADAPGAQDHRGRGHGRRAAARVPRDHDRRAAVRGGDRDDRRPAGREGRAGSGWPRRSESPTSGCSS